MRLSVTYNFYQTQKDVFFRRGDRIRTYDIQLPKLALYQAELRPVVQKVTRRMARDGIEPPTQGFSVLCSTD